MLSINYKFEELDDRLNVLLGNILVNQKGSKILKDLINMPVLDDGFTN